MESRFASYATRFVRAYWEVVKAGTFDMPPNEPVDESLEELLARVSHSTEVQNAAGQSVPVYRLRMADTHGDWWIFSFQHGKGGWELIGASANSDDEKNPHDLLGSMHEKCFKPFLTHVAGIAQKGPRAGRFTRA